MVVTYCICNDLLYSFIQQNFIEWPLWSRHGAGLALWGMQR